MSLPEARAEAIAARFAAAGLSPRVMDHGSHTCVEADVPDSVAAEAWQELVTVLDQADSFGLFSGRSGCTAWATVRKETPATEQAVRGHGRQL